MSRDRRDGTRPRVLTIVGPTAVGKTAIALGVARSVGGEIVSADSRQVYRGMDLGTAKPTPAERAEVPHHLIDIVDPRDAYDAAAFTADAERAIAAIFARGAVPLVVGGTGFYVSSLFHGLFQGPARDDEVRQELTARAEAEGSTALHAELAAVDPRSAARIHPNDASRVIRALEVYLSTGRTLSEWHGDSARVPRFAPRYFGLTMSRERLYERIDRRVDAMMENGLLSEVRSLVASRALTADMPSASAVGYRELLALGSGASSSDLAAAVRLIKRNTRRYAKRQLTWFRALEGVRWIDLDKTDAAAAVETIAAHARRA